jgi:ADP-dependent NAD(P)H-hydrate dehydratase / NAD(P)H-hydrate epimerase
MKIFQTDQIRKLDAITIEKEPISSIELMNRAANALFERIQKQIHPEDFLLVMAGPGNNGGDALAVSRLLLEHGYKVEILLCQPDAKISIDTLEQLIRLQQTEGAHIRAIDSPQMLHQLHGGWHHLIDGLFGTGLNRPLKDYFAEIVHWANRQNLHTISIDLPSGLFGEDNLENLHTSIVQADLTLGLQFPRLAYLMPENEVYVGKWELVKIGILPNAIEQLFTPYTYNTAEDVASLLITRSQFAHKGSFGKVLLAAGCPEMTGAAILAARGALRAGAGLVYLRITEKAVPVIQAAVPEALVLAAETSTINDLDFAAVAIGPGIGTEPSQLSFLKRILLDIDKSLVLDADALNWLSIHPELLNQLPANSILTPHPKEFDRICGSTSRNGYERLNKAIEFAKTYGVYIALKGAHTACIDPDGNCSFNSSGNPGMATGGSGDVLTGIIVSLLSQGYSPTEATRLGVYLHGLSGDLALGNQSYESLIAGDLVEYLGQAFHTLNNLKQK